MERWELLNGLFDPKKIALLQLFFLDPDKAWYLNELAKGSGLSPATSLRIVRRLEKLGLVQVEKVSRLKLYKAASDDNFRYLGSFLQQERQILAEFVKEAATIQGVDSIIQHGKATKDRANIMLIGDSIDSGRLKELIASFRERHKFTVSPLTLTREQFDQMTNMGLYAGEKRILFTRP